MLKRVDLSNLVLGLLASGKLELQKISNYAPGPDL